MGDKYSQTPYGDFWTDSGRNFVVPKNNQTNPSAIKVYKRNYRILIMHRLPSILLNMQTLNPNFSLPSILQFEIPIVERVVGIGEENYRLKI